MKKILIYLPTIVLLYGCANQSSPTGGPQDKQPPELFSSSPENNSKNFSGKNIELVFTEDIKLKDPKEEILITPSVGKNTKYIVRRNRLTIEPEFPWKENTTYSLSFREGVQDITEGNPAENLRIAFSTGPVIDSLFINGIIKETFKETAPQKITVAVYQSDTFNIYKHAPVYFTKTDKQGRFSIQNLKDGDYFIYAFDDKNKNLKVESKTERHAFQVATINPRISTDSVRLSLILVDTRPVQLTSIRHTDRGSKVRFGKAVDSIKLISDRKKDFMMTQGDNETELNFYHAFQKGDSIKVTLSAVDSISQRIDTTFYIKYSETKTAAEQFTTREKKLSYDRKGKKINLIQSFSKPIGAIIYDSIRLQTDSATFTTIKREDLKLDTLKKDIHIAIPYEQIEKKEGAPKGFEPVIKFGKGAVISIEQDSSKAINRKVTIAQEKETGTVSFKVDTKEKNYIVQLIDKDNKVTQSAINPKEFTFHFVEPNDYKIFITIDKNGNGRWDAGNFLKREEPEKTVYYISEEGKYSFPIRANWEYGPLVIKF